MACEVQVWIRLDFARDWDEPSCLRCSGNLSFDGTNKRARARIKFASPDDRVDRLPDRRLRSVLGPPELLDDERSLDGSDNRLNDAGLDEPRSLPFLNEHFAPGGGT